MHLINISKKNIFFSPVVHIFESADTCFSFIFVIVVLFCYRYRSSSQCYVAPLKFFNSFSIFVFCAFVIFFIRFFFQFLNILTVYLNMYYINICFSYTFYQYIATDCSCLFIPVEMCWALGLFCTEITLDYLIYDNKYMHCNSVYWWHTTHKYIQYNLLYIKQIQLKNKEHMKCIINVHWTLNYIREEESYFVFHLKKREAEKRILYFYKR